MKTHFFEAPTKHYYLAFGPIASAGRREFLSFMPLGLDLRSQMHFQISKTLSTPSTFALPSKCAKNSCAWKSTVPPRPRKFRSRYGRISSKTFFHLEDDLGVFALVDDHCEETAKVFLNACQTINCPDNNCDLLFTNLLDPRPDIVHHSRRTNHFMPICPFIRLLLKARRPNCAKTHRPRAISCQTASNLVSFLNPKVHVLLVPHCLGKVAAIIRGVFGRGDSANYQASLPSWLHWAVYN